jgi:hypothetical protein
VLDPSGIAVSTAANWQRYPSAASNGTDYFVAWIDDRSGADYDIYGARVTSAGTVLDPSGLLIQQSPYDDLSLAVAYSACGKYLVTYQRFHDDPNFQSPRVMARMFYEYAANVTQDAGFDPLPTLTELCGDGDGVVEPGEEWQMTVQLINSMACTANNVKADLTVNPGSVVAATVCNNPGSYGDIPAGGTAQFAYSFAVDSGAICVNDLTFDVTNIASDEGTYPDEIAVFNVQVGQAETGTQVADPLAAQNGTVLSGFAPAFTIPGAAKSATLSYSLSGGTDLAACVEVALIDPFATAMVVKPLGAADANPYDVTGLYTGAGTYQLRLMEEAKGCGGGGDAQVAGGTLTVVDECQASACACPCVSDILPDAPVIWEGECVAFNATPSGGTPPYTFLWSTGATSQTITVCPVVTTVYDVTVTDSLLCVVLDSETVTVNPLSSCGEPSATDISPAVPPLTVGTTGVVAAEELACATGYVVYENVLGTWYGTPGRVCVSSASPNGDGTVTLTGYTVPADSWIVVASADAVGESSCGRDSAGAERNAQPGWPAPGPCP